MAGREIPALGDPSARRGGRWQAHGPPSRARATSDVRSRAVDRGWNRRGAGCGVVRRRAWSGGYAVLACAGERQPAERNWESTMIKVSVMYPNKPGARFDHAYYRDRHMPLVKSRMGDKCRYYTVD